MRLPFLILINKIGKNAPTAARVADGIRPALKRAARPAGLLVKEASKFKSDITIENGDKKGDAKKIFSVMGLGVKSGNTITVKLTGEDEEEAKDAILSFLEQNL